MSMPRHPGFTYADQPSGPPFIRLGLIIFIAVFLAIIASCATIYYVTVNSTGNAVREWRQERDGTAPARKPQNSFWKDYDEGGVRH